MKKFISDRRLYLTENGDQVVEAGDPRASFLLVSCAGRMIPSAIAARLELTISKKGRIKYPGSPKGLGKPAKAERAEETEDGEDPVEHKFGGEKTGGQDNVDPPAGDDADTSKRADPKGGADSAVAVDDLATRRAAAEALQEEKAKAREAAADDSDRNDEAAPAWKLKTSPAEYLEKWPTGKNAELAARVIAANAGADGAT